MLEDRSILSTLREAMARGRRREGVPMVVALVDERGPMPATGDADVRADGGDIAAHIARVRASVAPSMRDGDNGGVVSALVIVAHDLLAGGGAP